MKIMCNTTVERKNLATYSKPKKLLVQDIPMADTSNVIYTI